MKKWIVILWILLMVAVLSNMAQENKINKLENEIYRLREVIDSESYRK